MRASLAASFDSIDSMFATVVRAGLALLVVACDPGSDAASRATPNVVLVSIDTLRADATSPYGSHLRTPGFESLAEEAVLFERAFAPASETAPSHATLFTGQEVLRHGVVRNGVPLTDDADTLAELLRGRGYDTAGFASSWVLDARFGWDQGFDVYDATFPEEGATLDKEHLGYSGAPWLEQGFAGLDRRASETHEAVGRWLRVAREPFFLFIHYFDPHLPYLPPREYWARARRLEVDVTGRSHLDLTAEQIRGRITRYHGEVLFVDDAITALVARLRQLELGRPTLLVVTADHGEGMGKHAWMAHSIFLYEELTHVPLLFAWLEPRGAATRIATPVGLRDVAPTIVELTGSSPLPRPDGLSLADSVRDGVEPRERPIFAHQRAHDPSSFAPRSGLPGRKLSVRAQHWKLIRNWDGEDELYDLETDPDEQRNRIRDEREVAARMEALLDEHLEQMPPVDVAPHLSPQVREKLEALGYFE
jgi:arylsulfatase A-like enzyme